MVWEALLSKIVPDLFNFVIILPSNKVSIIYVICGSYLKGLIQLWLTTAVCDIRHTQNKYPYCSLKQIHQPMYKTCKHKMLSTNKKQMLVGDRQIYNKFIFIWNNEFSVRLLNDCVCVSICSSQVFKMLMKPYLTLLCNTVILTENHPKMDIP